MTSINRLRIVLLGLAILGVAVTLAAISHAQTPDYLYQLALAEAEQATADHVPDARKMVVPPTTGTTPAAQTPARKPALAIPKVLKQAAAARRGYHMIPESEWTWYGRPGSYLTNYTHLTTGEHAGLFDVAWLKTLYRQELNTLHTHAHHGTIDWNLAVRAKKPLAAKASGYWTQVKDCTQRGCRLRWVWVSN